MFVVYKNYLYRLDYNYLEKVLKLNCNFEDAFKVDFFNSKTKKKILEINFNNNQIVFEDGGKRKFKLFKLKKNSLFYKIISDKLNIRIDKRVIKSFSDSENLFIGSKFLQWEKNNKVYFYHLKS